MRYITQEQIDATVKLLKGWRLDPFVIAADGWDDDGYEAFVTNDAGERVLEYGERVRVRRDWPVDFPVEKLVEIRGGYR